MSVVSPVKSAAYALPPHLRNRQAGAASVSDSQVESEAQEQQQQTVRDGDQKGTFDARFICIAAAEEGTYQGKPRFSVRVALLDDPTDPLGCTVLDQERASLDHETKSMMLEARHNKEIKVDGNKAWKTYIKEKPEVLRRGTAISVGVFGTYGRFRDGAKERNLVAGDIVRCVGVTCKFNVVQKKDEVTKNVIDEWERVIYSAARVQFLCTKEELGAEENKVWNTWISSVAHEQDAFIPLRRDPKKNLDEAVAAKKAKQDQQASTTLKPPAGPAAGSTAAPPPGPATETTVAPDQDEDKLYARHGARVIPSRQEERKAGDEILTKECQIWKKRNFSITVPIGGVQTTHTVFRGQHKLGYKWYAAKGGVYGSQKDAFIFSKSLTEDQKKSGAVPERKARWQLRYDVDQVTYTADGQEDVARVHLLINCWSEGLAHTGIANHEHQMHLFPFMAEGLTGVMRCWIATSDSLQATEKERDPEHDMHYVLGAFSSVKKAPIQCLWVDHATTIVNTCWGPILPETVGDLLEWLGKQPDTPADSVGRDMSLMTQAEELTKYNPLNGARGRKVANLLELDKNLLSPVVVQQYDFYVLLNRSKRYIWPQVKDTVLGVEDLQERSKLLSEQMAAVIMNKPERATLAMDLFVGDASPIFTVFAIRRDYLDMRSLRNYQGTNAHEEVLGHVEDYLFGAEAQQQQPPSGMDADAGKKQKSFHPRE